MRNDRPRHRHRSRAQLCLAIMCAMLLASCVSTGAVQSTIPLAASSPPTHTHANIEIGDRERRDGRFVGLAISGGGSRAAVFGGAVLRELDRRGLLQQVDVLSAVSGGALPAAYYALDGYRTVDFSNGFMAQMGRNFQSEVLGRWLSPGNVLRYWFTEKTKSDTVIEVLDDELFHSATYADLNPARPKLLLNAANALTGEPFIISDESFASLESPLASFSVARAVYMSAAYPGVLDPVLLRNRSAKSTPASRTAVMVYDGGTVDNLGVKTLLTLLNKTSERKPLAATFPQGCLVIAVDATPRIGSENSKPLPASTVLLKSNRREVLEQAGIPADRQDRTMFGTFMVGNGTGPSACRFWHLSLRQLPDDDPLGAKVTRIKTNLGLDQADQEALMQAAQILIEQGLNEVGEQTVKQLMSPLVSPAGTH